MRNAVFYDSVGKFDNSEFYRLDDTEKFDRCHKILSDKRFKETDVHQALFTALNGLHWREEDGLLVELIKEDCFDVIVSTSVDDFLENACLRAGLEEERDFHVLHPLRDTNQNLTLQESERLTIVKVFGDLGSRSYTTAGKELNLAAHPSLQAFLTTLLAQEVLMVGYDPVWDKAIEQAFPTTGNTVYYVNEQELSDNNPLHQILLQRHVKYYVGSHSSYRGFMKTLRRSFTQPYMSVPSTFPSYHESSQSEQKKKTVFISYCHDDKRFLEELLPHLDIYEQQGLVDVWSDKKIEVGMGWRKKIGEALEAAEVAILLISKYFLASKFIREVELPQLLLAARGRGLVIIPVVLRPCVLGDTQLHQFQAINSPERPVSKIRLKADRDVIWVDVAKKVRDTWK